MPAHLHAYCLHGFDVHELRLEAGVAQGMPHFSIIGMAGTSVQESKERVRSAIKHSGFTFPMNRKVVNLSPAEIHKRGSHFDLAIAVGLLIASEQMQPLPEDVLLLGELGLEGGVRAVSGILPMLLAAEEKGIRQVILPEANLKEASLVEELELVPITHLREAVEHFEGEGRAPARVEIMGLAQKHPWDFAEISGHAAAKRALTVAAAGGHHVLMTGPPGTGKSMLARAFPSLLPPLSRDELLEVLRIYSVTGRNTRELCLRRPFRHVHHSCSAYALIGGGIDLMPGEVSLAHRGVLFMDELAEFKRNVLEQLREPLEEGCMHLRRGRHTSFYPARFQLIAAMNPCPCGYFGDSLKDCNCNPYHVELYQSKVSGPLLDRIDLHIQVPRIAYDELQNGSAEASSVLQAKVIMARDIQAQRFKDEFCKTNHEMKVPRIKAEPLAEDVHKLLRIATSQYHLSGRAVHRTLRVARTIADLEASEHIQAVHLMEALQYRVGEG